jgi:hypothetical protein
VRKAHRVLAADYRGAHADDGSCLERSTSTLAQLLKEGGKGA